MAQTLVTGQGGPRNPWIIFIFCIIRDGSYKLTYFSVTMMCISHVFIALYIYIHRLICIYLCFIQFSYFLSFSPHWTVSFIKVEVLLTLFTVVTTTCVLGSTVEAQ